VVDRKGMNTRASSGCDRVHPRLQFCSHGIEIYFYIHVTFVFYFCGTCKMFVWFCYSVPGPSKITSRRNSVAKKKPYELDNGLVPLPVKVCFECRK